MTHNEPVFAEWTQRILLNDAVILERHIRALLQPRPRWLPECAWRRLVARVVVLEERDADVDETQLRWGANP
jgi:hypothetical protein